MFNKFLYNSRPRPRAAAARAGAAGAAPARAAVPESASAVHLLCRSRVVRGHLAPLSALASAGAAVDDAYA